MKVQYCSDLNLEFPANKKYLKANPIRPEGEILLLAGDIIPFGSRERLNQLTPDMNDLRRISHSINCNGYFVFTFDSDAPNILTHGRMFAPAIGVDEDPVTGNANGPLGAYIAKHKLVNFDSTGFSFTAKQGEALGRAGTMEVAVDISGGEPVKVAISGTAVAVFKTVIEL